MKMFVSLFFIAMMVMSVTCSAARVRLYDGSFNNFMDGYSSHQGVFSSKLNLNLAITEVKHIPHSDVPYILVIGKGSSKVSVNLFPSTNGGISYLKVLGNMKRDKQSKSTAAVMFICLIECGFNESEIAEFNNKLDTYAGNSQTIKIWCSNKRRYITTEMKLDNNERLVATIYATNN